MATTINRAAEALPLPVGPDGLSAWSRALREDVLADAAAVMHRIDRDPEFRRSLEAIRTKYWRRRNFISLLEDNAERLHPE